jgi:hypothetical protein
MLRGKTDSSQPAAPAIQAASDNDIPSLDQPYSTGERPPGILFYQPKQSFWLPYLLLQRMEFAADELRLAFAAEDVVIRGRSLHPLYVEAARQKLFRVVEQGERYAALSPEGTLITEIERQPHSAEAPV